MAPLLNELARGFRHAAAHVCVGQIQHLGHTWVKEVTRALDYFVGDGNAFLLVQLFDQFFDRFRWHNLDRKSVV